MTEKYTKQFYVAGVKFRKGWKENLQTLDENEEFSLVPEFSNRFDPNAVKIVHAKGTEFEMMFGYVPSKTGEAAEIADLIREGKELTATLIELSPDFEPWKALLVEVKEV